MKIQDKQFTVKYDIRSLVHGVSIPVFMQKIAIPSERLSYSQMCVIIAISFIKLL